CRTSAVECTTRPRYAAIATIHQHVPGRQVGARFPHGRPVCRHLACFRARGPAQWRASPATAPLQTVDLSLLIHSPKPGVAPSGSRFTLIANFCKHSYCSRVTTGGMKETC